ncbi:MAG: type II secretion system protein [Candidatus Dadabacteria bacterium]|nr:type II secretion system protein [Candidatus Dadabacteria bacterium]
MKRKDGFTLLEILVVILIIGAFFFVAVPKFQDLTEVNLKSASRNLSATIKYLYNEAAFKKNIYRLAFDLENGEYWIETLQGNEYRASGDSSHKRRKLPTGVYFKDVITERSLGRNPLTDEKDFILFLPTGFVEPAVIHLYTDSERYYTLVTKPYTGGTKVYDEYVELLKR